MARYCANQHCVHATHPLPETGGPCPKCGGVQFRLNPDVATVTCGTCQSTNEADVWGCWACGETLNQHRVIR